MKWTTKDKDRVKARFDYWITRLNITSCVLYYDFYDKLHETASMTISTQYPYRRATISVYADVIKQHDGLFDLNVIHELMHFILAPMDSSRLLANTLWSDAEETCVENLAMAFNDIHQALLSAQDRLEKPTKSR